MPSRTPTPKGSYRARSSPFTPHDWETALGALEMTVGGGSERFTIGRSVARNLRLLQLRYATSRRIIVLWEGSAGRAVALERALQRRARRRHGCRVANVNVGGGRRAPDDVHVVYVVLWGSCGPTSPSVDSVLGGSVRRLRRGGSPTCPARRRAVTGRA